MTTKEIVLNVRLEGAEVDALEGGKQRSGIRTNAEFIRFVIKAYKDNWDEQLTPRSE
jgi:hypothetical protein